MKKNYFAMSLLLMLAAVMGLSSCGEDYRIAYTLEGTWRGDMLVSHEYDGIVYDAAYSEITFETDPFAFRSGSGYWIDYYDDYGWGRNYVANHIRWQVQNGVIRVDFIEEGVSVWIEDYRLSDNRFVGVIYDGSNRVSFNLYHVSSPNWNDYDYGWDYFYGKGVSAPGKMEAPKRLFRSQQ